MNAHQDSTFLYTDPPSCLGLWWALEECTEDNGCLFVVPGSHKAGVSRTFRRTEGGAPDAPLTEFHPAEAPPLDVEGAVPLLASPGDLVLLHGAVVHYSHPNTSAASRHAYSVHVVDSGEGVAYPASNWLQRPPGMPFRDLLSTDPEGPPLAPAA